MEDVMEGEGGRREVEGEDEGGRRREEKGGEGRGRRGRRKGRRMGRREGTGGGEGGGERGEEEVGRRRKRNSIHKPVPKVKVELCFFPLL